MIKVFAIIVVFQADDTNVSSLLSEQIKYIGEISK
jgi:hypothetical protein